MLASMPHGVQQGRRNATSQSESVNVAGEGRSRLSFMQEEGRHVCCSMHACTC